MELELIHKSIKNTTKRFLPAFFLPPIIVPTMPSYIPPKAAPSAPIISITTLFDSISRVVGYAQVLFWILAVVMGIYAAFLYLTSYGSPEKVGKATKTLVYAAIACAVAIIAYGIPLIVDNFIKP